MFARKRTEYSHYYEVIKAYVRNVCVVTYCTVGKYTYSNYLHNVKVLC